MAVLAVISTASQSAFAKRPGDYLRTSVELRLRSPAEIAQVEIVVSDIRNTQPQVRPVSDLMMRLTADGGAIDAALQAANVPAGVRPKPLLRAAVYTVTGGRIMRDTDATCDQWRGDLSICRLDCDGGMFTLRRHARGELAMLIGAPAGGSSETTRAGFALNACAASDAGELVLSPKAGRPLVELALSGD